MQKDLHRVTARPMIVGRVVTATIALTCVLIVYDGWAKLRLIDVICVIVGPVLAIFIAHVFAASVVQEMELGRRPHVNGSPRSASSRGFCFLQSPR
jgi:hypothetical protein